MAKRQQIPKSIRFEVFKRDSFACQYCGKQAPDVKLEIDHIKPVSKGGKNDILNLITSCFDCNRGKGKKELSDSTTINKQKKQLNDLQERREIIEMMSQWKSELLKQREEELDIIDELILSITDHGLTEIGKTKMKKLLRDFGFHLVYEATEIAMFKYYDGEHHSTLELAFNKIGGICYNKTHNIGADHYGY